MSDNIITQVTAENYTGVIPGVYEDAGTTSEYNSKIHLYMRGKDFDITRDELMSLPESILLSLFPNGVFLNKDGQVITNLTEDDVVHVNFDPTCFQYILEVFGKANSDSLDMTPISPQTSSLSKTQENVLKNKPAIIVLREDLDYYVIPPVVGLDADKIKHLKLEAASELLKNAFIFSGLGHNLSSDADNHEKLGPAERHLFDMLCSSGFKPDGKWGNRSIEPSKCSIQSLSLVRLSSHDDTPPESPSLKPVLSDASSVSRKSRSRIASLASSASRAASRSLSKSRRSEPSHNKLLLFWRKPARKCWWTNEVIELRVPADFTPDVSDGHISIKVHIRRVWTLELSVIGVQ